MALKKKLHRQIALSVFLSGTIVLFLSIIYIYLSNYKTILKKEQFSTENYAIISANSVEKLLFEKIKMVSIIANSELLKKSLEKSNFFYSSLSSEKRNNLINSLNKKWMSIKDIADPFILKYVNNPIANYLKSQEKIFPGEFGEIFLTNKFGALIASTSKLTTFKHNHKYWWREAYNNGIGAVFIDDRGYDDSVGDYVVGIVIPVKKDHNIIGILKANIKILGGLSEILDLNRRATGFCKMSLIRSKGRIIFEKGIIPLSRTVNSKVVNLLNSREAGNLLTGKYIIGYSRVNLISKDILIKFGGTKETIDHKFGNSGELWYVLVYKKLSNIKLFLAHIVKDVLYSGILLVFLLSILAYFVGKFITNPINILIKTCENIAKRDFNFTLDLKREDEIGILTKTIHNMAKELERTTASKEELEQSERKLRYFFRFSPVVIYELDSSDFSLIWFSENSTNILGYSLEELKTPKNYIEKIYKDDRKIIVENFKNLFKNKILTREYRFVRKDGKIIWIYDTLILTENNNIIGALTDITEHKKLFIKVIENEQKFKTLFELSPDAMFIIDERFNIIDCNSRSLEIFDCEKSHIKGQSVIDCTFEEDTLKDYLIKAKDGERQFFKVKMKSCKHTMFYAEISLSLMVIKSTKLILAIIRDITDRINLEQRLRLLSAVALQSIIIVVITDKDGKIVFVNKAFEKVTGYSYDEAIGQNPRILKSGRHSKSFYKELWDTILSGEVWQGEFINKRKDGSIYYEEANIFPIKNENGEIVNFAAIKQDVTEKKRLEENLMQARKLEAVGALASGIAHDFNNILTVISGNAELAANIVKKKPELVEKNLQNILNTIERASSLVYKLLAFSRKQPFFPMPIDLSNEIKELEPLLKRLVTEDIDFLINIKDENVKIYFDKTQLEQIIVNLIVNARDAIERVEKKEKVIEVSIEKEFLKENNILGLKEGEYAKISVSDSGIGIKKDLIGKIFEPFFTTKEEGKGSGLGLATIYGIVKQNKGGINVVSEVGKGSTFEIYIPVLKSSGKLVLAKDEDKKVDISEIIKGRPAILIVEDETMVRKVLVSLLKSLGFKTFEASNGVEALEIIKQHSDKIRLVVSDVIMPEMDGKELYEKIKKINENIQFLFLSGYPESIIGKKGFNISKDNFLQKPVSSKELAEKISNLLGKYNK